jgi:hypothetical protein
VTFSANSRNLDEATNYVYEYFPSLQRLAFQFIYFYYFQHAFSVRDEFIEQTRLRLKSNLATAISSAIEFV